MNDAKRISLGLDWLINSDIRLKGSDTLLPGGVIQGYNWKTQHYTYVYSEITGYTISLLVNAYRWTGNKRYLEWAQQSADFLLSMQVLSGENRGAIYEGLSLPGFTKIGKFYSFDAAMVLQGLLDLYSVTSHVKLIESARLIGDWLVNQMQRRDGSFLACLSLLETSLDKRVYDPFGDGGCLHAKHAIGLLKLYQNTGDEIYATSARQVCDWVLGLQDKDGAFYARGDRSKVVSHTHCYATEGLLYASEVLEEGRYRDAARMAGLWLVNSQNRDGSIRIDYKQTWWKMGRRAIEVIHPKRVTDATAQAVRIWLILNNLDQKNIYLDATRSAKSFLITMQNVALEDKNAQGGFYFCRDHPIMYTWCTMFAIQALIFITNKDRETFSRQLGLELF